MLGEGDLGWRREIQSVIFHCKCFFSKHFHIHTIYRKVIQHSFHYTCSVQAWLQLCFPSAFFSELYGCVSCVCVQSIQFLSPLHVFTLK